MQRQIFFTPIAISQLYDWAGESPETYERIRLLCMGLAAARKDLLEAAVALENQLRPYRSLRIAGDHRLVFRITQKEVVVISCKLFYN